MSPVARFWWDFPSWDLCIGASAKAGSTSLANVAVQVGLCPSEARKDYRPLRKVYAELPARRQHVAIIREPLDRFMSVWRDKVRDQGTGNKFYKSLAGATPDEFWEVVKGRLDQDAHTLPQYHLTPKWEKCTLVPLEALSLWWMDQPFHKEAQMPHKNATAPAHDPFSIKTESEVYKAYAKDLAIYRSAWRATPSPLW